MIYQHLGLSDRLAERRTLRKRAQARRGTHPLSHVDPDKCYEWMRSDCAAYDTARQAREDGLIATITQISSAAILAVPGLIFSSNQKFPAIHESPWLFAGIGAFLAALVVAMAEQYLSAKAYRQQSKIAQNYYTLASHKSGDASLVPWVRRTRNFACIAFASAVIITSAALSTLRGQENGRTSSAASTAAPSTATATPAAAASTASSSSPAASKSPH